MKDPIDEIIPYECRVWGALVTGDKAADEALLHRAFIGVYSDGFADRTAHSGQLDHGPALKGYALEDVRTERLGHDHALICYRATFQRITRDAPETMYVSSIWRRQGKGWVNVFSQDTPAL